MIKIQQTVDTVRERERERERAILAKICFFNHVQKLSVLDKLKRNKCIEIRVIGLWIDAKVMCDSLSFYRQNLQLKIIAKNKRIRKI